MLLISHLLKLNRVVSLLLSIIFSLFFSATAFAAPQPACSSGATITLKGQSEVDQWNTSYDCVDVAGSLIIHDRTGDPVTDISKLSTLRTVAGKLRIGEAATASTLQNLTGLDNLTSVRDLFITNTGVQNVAALTNLTSISGDLDISHNSDLDDISGLSNVSTLVHDLTLSNLPKLPGSQLIHLPQSKSLFIYNMLLITDTDKANLEALGASSTNVNFFDQANLSVVPNFVSATILSLNNLPDLISLEPTGLPSATINSKVRTLTLNDLPLDDAELVNLIASKLDALFLISMPQITSLSNLVFGPAINFLSLSNIPNLGSLDWSGPLTSVGTLKIEKTPLSTLSSLKALTTINVLFISDNSNLLSLDGLDNLVGDMKTIKIQGNSELTNANALRGVSKLTSTLLVYFNPKLAVCDVFKPIIDASPPTITKYVASNNASCSTANYTNANITLTPNPVDYGSVATGNTVTKTITVTKTGSPSTRITTSSLTLIDDVTPDEYTITNDTCTNIPLDGNASCTIDVQFTATRNVPDNGTLTLAYKQWSHAVISSSSTPVTLHYQGTAASAVLTPPSPIDFGSIAIGQNAPKQIVTISDNGGNPLTITSISSNNNTQFPIISNNCGSTVAAGSSCTVSLGFTPSAAGAVTAKLTVVSNSATGSPAGTENIVLNGIGLALPTATPSASNVDFGDVIQGTAKTKSISITNNGDIDLIMGTITSSVADYTLQSDSCSGQTVLPKTSCNITIRFSPSKNGVIAGSLSIPSNAQTTSPINLQGTGQSAASLTITPTTHAFGVVALGSTSDQIFTLKNIGSSGSSAQISLVSLDNSDYLILADNCTGQSLLGGSSCTITVRFEPTTSGADNAHLSIVNSTATSPITVGLTGIGGSAVSYITPSHWDFGSVEVGTPSAVKTFTISDNGGAALKITGLSADDPEFLISNDNCSGITVSIGATCTFDVTFIPNKVGGISGTMTVVSDSTSSPDKVALSATGVQAAVLHFSSPSIQFAVVSPGASSTQSVTITNFGGTDLVISAMTIGGSNPGAYTLANNLCLTTLIPAASCSFDIIYAPTVSGTNPASVLITSNASSSPDALALSGSVAAAAAVPVPVMSNWMLVLLSIFLAWISLAYHKKEY